MTSIYLNTNHLSQPKVLLRSTQNTPRRCASQDYFLSKNRCFIGVFRRSRRSSAYYAESAKIRSARREKLRRRWRRHVPFLHRAVESKHRLLPARRDVEVHEPQLPERGDRNQRMHVNADSKTPILIANRTRQMIARHECAIAKLTPDTNAVDVELVRRRSARQQRAIVFDQQAVAVADKDRMSIGAYRRRRQHDRKRVARDRDGPSGK